jgi:energy-coupling factor transporter ATP-binding protein EcfA2
MILITRPPEPAAYAKKAAVGRAALEETTAEGGYKSQRTYKFDASIFRAARQALAAASNGKCAYCETFVEKADVDHYRPKSRAEGLAKGDTAPDHYWWLAYSWDNLMILCSTCNRNKRNRFPVIGRRIERGDPLADESPLLLDPYGAEDPARHLWFEDDGMVRAMTQRGDTTIEVLGLNRPDLVARRQAAASRTSRLLVNAPDAESQAAVSDPAFEFAGLRRQLLTRYLTSAEFDSALPSNIAATFTKVSAHGGSTWIEEVDLVDFGCFGNVELRFSAPGEGREPWIVVLGPNGTGKSTILRAIALALCSESARRRLAPDASRYVNRTSGATRGYVRVRFNQGQEIRLEARRGARQFEVKETRERPDFALVGYGSTRMLPRRKTSALRATGPKLTNLFDSWAPLAQVEPWLADPGRVSSKDFKVLASSLKTLMGVGDAVELRRRSGRLTARSFGTSFDLGELSDGYRSTLALALDLVLALGGEQGQGLSTENLEGMVLIDELEVHLHPEWKLQLVSDLRSVFPHLQFVATTHDPLCLRGLETGELHVLERREEGVAAHQIDVPSGLDADEILTGSWFGLDTTLDQQIEDDLIRYRTLRLDGRAPDDAALTDLRRHLERSLGSYAGTSIGRIMVEAAGDLLAEQTADAERTTSKLTKDQIKARLLAHAREHTS